MKPLQEMKTIRGSKQHLSAGLGAGQDLVAKPGTRLFAPFDGYIETYWGRQGGNWSRLIRANGDRIEFAHLSRYVVTSGNVHEGELIGYTGNTGAITTNPHLHIQIFRDGKRLWPETYDWEPRDKPLVEQVNSCFRTVWARNPMPKEQKYFAHRIYKKSITTKTKLLDVMHFWHSMPRFLFILEMQRYGFFK